MQSRVAAPSPSPSPSSPRRRAYKWGRTHAPSDAWRQRLLSNCARRMKEARNSTMDEWRRTRKAENDAQASLFAFIEASEEQALEQQEQYIINDAEDVEELARFHMSLLPSEQTDKMEMERVLCPVCCTTCLNVTDDCTRITCPCGLSIDTNWTENGEHEENGNRSTIVRNQNRLLAQMRQQLEAVFTTHQSVCQHGLTFSVQRDDDVSMNTQQQPQQVGGQAGQQERTAMSQLWAHCDGCRQRGRVL